MKRLIKKTQNISNIENNAFSRLRKITADAYDWVKERAEHIQDKNPDMDEGESYGIAWIQYKQEHPKWKSKKQKEKKAEYLIAKPRDRGQDGKPINHMETSTKGKTNFAHRLLHMWWKNPEKTDWTKQQIIDEHIKVVKAMKDFNMNHNMKDKLDNTLPEYLQTKKETTAEDGGGGDAGISTPVSTVDSTNHSTSTDSTVQYNIVDNKTPDSLYMSWYPTVYDYRKNDKKRRKNKMKSRLKKLNELHDSYEDNMENDFYEVYKNPTSAELSEIKNEDSKGNIRGVISNDGTIFAWSADLSYNDVGHLSKPVDTNGLRFSINGGDFIIDGGNTMDLYTVRNFIRQYANAITSLTSNKKLQLMNVTDANEDDEMTLDLNELLEPAMASIKSRLKKTAAFLHCHQCGWDNGDWGYPSKNTVYKTEEEFKEKNPEGKCPKCGTQELDID